MTETPAQRLSGYPVGLVEAVMEAVLVLHVDLAGTISFCSEHALAEWSLSAEDIIGLPFRSLVAPGDPFASELDARLASLVDGTTFTQRFECVLPNGRKLWIKAGFHATFDAAGTVNGACVTGLDISHSQRRETEIRTRLAAIENTQLTGAVA